MKKVPEELSEKLVELIPQAFEEFRDENGWDMARGAVNVDGEFIYRFSIMKEMIPEQLRPQNLDAPLPRLTDKGMKKI